MRIALHKKWALSLRSRRKPRAWGVSPRFRHNKFSSPRMRARDQSRQKLKDLVGDGLSPISRAHNQFNCDPGAYAPGFMLPPAPQAKSPLSAKPMRIALLLLSVLLLILATAITGLACDCMTSSPAESLRRADAVFEGEVVRIETVDNRTIYTFAVQKSLKGPAATEAVISGTGYNCDAQFSPGVVYRVYAHRFEGKLTSGQCSGNKVLKIKKHKKSSHNQSGFLKREALRMTL